MFYIVFSDATSLEEKHMLDAFRRRATLFSYDYADVRRTQLRSEARERYFKLFFLNKCRVLLGGRIRVRDEQLAPWIPGNPKTPHYLFWCRACREPDIDHEHGWIQRLDCSVCKKLQFPSSPTPAPVV